MVGLVKERCSCCTYTIGLGTDFLGKSSPFVLWNIKYSQLPCYTAGF